MLVVAAAVYVLGHPSNTFVLLPDRPHSAAAIVTVQGETPIARTDGPGIYYLDVLVHRASLGETWLAPLESDAERLPAQVVIPPAGNQTDLNRVDALDVQGSKRLAALVALRALGRKVTVTGGGARIDAVDPKAPAHATGLAAGMVIVGDRRHGIRTLDGLQAPRSRTRSPATPSRCARSTARGRARSRCG